MAKTAVPTAAAMKTIGALDAKNRFGELIEAAQRQPVAVTRNGRPSVIVVSAESYERRRRLARDRVRQAMDRARGYAQAQGLTEEKLTALLAADS
jgi:prevent-host-death family protein